MEGFQFASQVSLLWQGLFMPLFGLFGWEGTSEQLNMKESDLDLVWLHSISLLAFWAAMYKLQTFIFPKIVIETRGRILLSRETFSVFLLLQSVQFLFFSQQRKKKE